MRYRTQTWKNIVERNRFAMETKLIIDGVEYTDISPPIIERAIGSKPLEIGNVISGSLRVNVLASGQFAPGAEVTVMARIKDRTDTSEWKKFGVFYIDQQPYNPCTGLVEITAYDALKRAEQIYDTSALSPTIWNAPFYVIVEDIAEQLNVGIDPRVRIPDGMGYYLPNPATDGYSILDVLSGMAVCLGGNWIMTDEGLLRLIPLVGLTDYSFKVIDTLGYGIVDRLGNQLVWRLTQGGETPTVDISTTVRPGTRPTSAVPIGGTDEEMSGADETMIVQVVLDKLSTSGTFSALRVALETGSKSLDDHYYDKGSPPSSAPSASSSGVTASSWIIRGSSPYATYSAQTTLRDYYNGMHFCPFEAGGCICDPCAELGDQVRIGSIRSVLASMKRTFGVLYRCDLGFPGSEELTAQYPYLGNYDRKTTQSYKPLQPEQT